ncbi:MAG TPA: ABC transporter ATP-binding protein [Albidovulum sp.]|uniref:ABC transporter ATP-binding protein n=1 Tax=Albidovulum sp. TaxID=1872424 RepID=UPI002BCC19CC|nr:ABC transporter ATP-binding protein [Albidovulum sp.]
MTAQPRPVPEASAQPAIFRLSGVVKSYGPHNAIDHVDLEIRPRELFTLLGPSGSGKSTILRAIAGLIGIDGGSLTIEGRDVRNVPTHQRNIGMVFQSLALFPHMSVFDNIAFPLRMRREPQGDIARRVAQSLDIVRLPKIAERRVHELSGGQQQRVALARALVYNPKLLLLDEPLGALDKRLREEMQLEIVRLHREIDVTIINVTHDQVEAMVLSDRVGVMSDGKLMQVGSGEVLYRRPANRFVADFLGRANVVDGTLRIDGAGPAVITPGGARIAVTPERQIPDGRRATAILRAEDIEMAVPGDSGSPGLGGEVTLRLFEGEAVYYEIAVPGIGRPLRVASRTGEIPNGAKVRLTWPRDKVWAVAEDSDG